METSSSSPKLSVKDRIKLTLKFTLVGLVFYYLYQKGLITQESFARLLASPQSLTICLILMIFNTAFGALRWQALLRANSARLSFKEVLKLNLVGNFFNIALPGAVSGDFVKAVYAAKHFPDKRAPVFGSMLFDRILGVSAMVLVGAFSAVISVLIPWGSSLPNALLYSISAVGAGVLLFFAYLFLSHKRDPLLHVLKWITRKNEKLGALNRLYDGVMNYRSHPKKVLKAIVLSVLIHMFLILMASSITETISPSSLSLIAVAVVVPIGMLATAIPVLPAGVGTGHAAFYALYKMVGSDQGAQVFSLIVLYQVLVGIVGGVVYLKVLHESHKS